jgi:hypothetical protein
MTPIPEVDKAYQILECVDGGLSIADRLRHDIFDTNNDTTKNYLLNELCALLHGMKYLVSDVQELISPWAH